MTRSHLVRRPLGGDRRLPAPVDLGRGRRAHVGAREALVAALRGRRGASLPGDPHRCVPRAARDRAACRPRRPDLDRPARDPLPDDLPAAGSRARGDVGAPSPRGGALESGPQTAAVSRLAAHPLRDDRRVADRDRARPSLRHRPAGLLVHRARGRGGVHASGSRSSGASRARSASARSAALR